MKSTPTRDFIELINACSDEHKKAMALLHDLPGSMVSILRQELDSMIRVLYLLSVPNLPERERLMEATLQGKKWEVKTQNGKYKVVTDKDMVAISEKFQGWSKSVYRFGCAFIHLSCFHAYIVQDPLKTLLPSERLAILSHMRYYYGGPINDNPSFHELAGYFPRVFEKIQSNLECYLEDLEQGRIDN
jgi:hypothetical protein